MKSGYIIVAGMLAAVCLTVAVMAAEKDDMTQMYIGMEQKRQAGQQPVTPVAASRIASANDVNSEPNEPNTSAEPNEVNEPGETATSQQERRFRELEGQRRLHERLWSRVDSEVALELEKEVGEQVIAELEFVRQIALEEQATKATEAIDRLVAGRRQRLDRIDAQIEKEKDRELRPEEADKNAGRRDARGRRPGVRRDRGSRRPRTDEQQVEPTE